MSVSVPPGDDGPDAVSAMRYAIIAIMSGMGRRASERTRWTEAGILVGAVVIVAVLVRAAIPAVQRRPIPLLLWVVVGTLAAAGGVVNLLTGRPSDARSRQELRHSSGELVVVRVYRDRRRRGTRIALDWKYSMRSYLFGPSLLRSVSAAASICCRRKLCGSRLLELS